MFEHKCASLISPYQEDSKQNIINVTLFESHLSHFLLENSCFFKHIYLKLLDKIELFIKANRNSEISRRNLSRIFYDLGTMYPGCDSFVNIKQHFHLVAADTCIKKIAETFLNYKKEDNLEFLVQEKCTLSHLAYQSLYQNPAKGLQTLNKHLRLSTLFLEKNRGVKENIEVYQTATKDLGIAEQTPQPLQKYFNHAHESARFYYQPDYKSCVATWLYERHLPVISGTSGTTELILSRVVPLHFLEREELRMLILAQAAAMVAMGHHSFFECFLVADRFGFKLQETDYLIDFYAQCIPEEIKACALFKTFLQDKGHALLDQMPLYRQDLTTNQDQGSNGLTLLKR